MNNSVPLDNFSQASEKGLEALSESVRSEMREYCQKSLYFLNKAVIGFTDFNPHLHKELCNHVQDDSYNRKLILVPRNHFKSSAVTIGYPVFLLINDSEERVLLSNATATNSQHFLRRIKAIFERNVAFRWLFPELIPPDLRKVKWNETEMLINRKRDFPESSVEAIGLGGVVTSRHYTVHIKDDLIDEKTILSSENLEKIIEWHRYSESLLQSPVHSKEIVIGTRYHEGDIYGFIIENEPNYNVYQRSAIEKGKVIFPEKFTIESLEAIRRKQGSTIFQCQYMNEPYSPEDQVFKSFELFSDVKKNEWSFFLTTDFAASTKKKAKTDSDVMTVAGFDTAGKEWIVDVRKGKWNPEEIETILLDIWQKWHPINMRCEEVAFQEVHNFYLRKFFHREKITWACIPMKRASEAKASRILRLQPRFENKMIAFHMSLPDLVELKKEVIRYPKVLHDDFLDTLADQEENGQLFGYSPHEEDNPLDTKLKSIAHLDDSSRRYWERKIRAANVTPNWSEEMVC